MSLLAESSISTAHAEVHIYYVIRDLRAVGGERRHPAKVTGVRSISVTVIVVVVRIRADCDVIGRCMASAETRLSVSH